MNYDLLNKNVQNDIICPKLKMVSVKTFQMPVLCLVMGKMVKMVKIKISLSTSGL